MKQAIWKLKTNKITEVMKIFDKIIKLRLGFDKETTTVVSAYPYNWNWLMSKNVASTRLSSELLQTIGILGSMMMATLEYIMVEDVVLETRRDQAFVVLLWKSETQISSNQSSCLITLQLGNHANKTYFVLIRKLDRPMIVNIYFFQVKYHLT